MVIFHSYVSLPEGIGCPLTSPLVPLVPTAQDSVILDFEWFANTSDYGFRDSGESWYEDFGWYPQLFSAPTQQLKKYLEDRIVVPISW